METPEKTPETKKRKRREPRGWYIADGIRMPLEEYWKDEPEYTGPKRSELVREFIPNFGTGEVLDVRIDKIMSM
jgi:hypothetical protein